jgi:HlyD family secretion protein
MTIARWIFAAVIVGVVAVVAAGSLGPRPVPPTAIKTATVEKMTITRTVSGAGKLEPVRKVNVSSNITGTLLKLNVDIGSLVKEGDVLGQIDTSRYKAQVDQMRAQLGSARADAQRAEANVKYLRGEAERLEKLVAQKIASEAELTKAQSVLSLAGSELVAAQSRSQMARASLDEAQSALGWATLIAPVDATVLAVNHREGERVRGSDFAEDVILVLGSLNEVEVKLEVGEYDVIHIKPGQPASIEIDAFNDRRFAGKVIDSGRDAIVKNAGTENEVTSFPVWVTLDDPPKNALSGMSAQVTISTDTHEGVLAVPIQSVTVRPAGGPGGPGNKAGKGETAAKPGEAKGDQGDTDDKPEKVDKPKEGEKSEKADKPNPRAPGKDKLEKVVFVVKDDVVSRRAVEVGLSSETHVEITGGLQPGEIVVEGPYRTLARELEDDMAVTVEPARP